MYLSLLDSASLAKTKPKKTQLLHEGNMHLHTKPFGRGGREAQNIRVKTNRYLLPRLETEEIRKTAMNDTS